MNNEQILHIESFISNHTEIMSTLLGELPLKQEEINFGYGPVPMPRLISWHGDKPYKYSGKTFQPSPWTETLISLKSNIEEYSNATFNSVLVNYYRDGKDSISWHADDEPEIDNRCIASISLGGSRSFHMKNNLSGELIKYSLGYGDLFLMYNCQKTWKHSIPKTKKQVSPRLNLTFRNVII
jgi:alkylated DNA repair dioxygenase AlkB